MQVIYGKAGDVAKECESLTLLGEVDPYFIFAFFAFLLALWSLKVSLENSNFTQAVEDLAACLAKRIKALPADSR